MFQCWSATKVVESNRSQIPAEFKQIFKHRQSIVDYRDRWLKEFWQESWDSFLRCEFYDPDSTIFEFSFDQDVVHDQIMSYIDDNNGMINSSDHVCLIRNPEHRCLWDRHCDNKRIERDIGLDQFARAIDIRDKISPGQYDELVRDCMTILDGNEIEWRHYSRLALSPFCRSPTLRTARVQVVSFPFCVRLQFNSCCDQEQVELGLEQDQSIMRELVEQCRTRRRSEHHGSAIDRALSQLNHQSYEHYERSVRSLPFSFHTEIYHQFSITDQQLRSFLYQHRHACPLYEYIFERNQAKNLIQQLMRSMEVLKTLDERELAWWKFWYEVHRMKICIYQNAIDPIRTDSIAFMSNQISSIDELDQELDGRGIPYSSRFPESLPIDLLIDKRMLVPSRGHHIYLISS